MTPLVMDTGVLIAGLYWQNEAHRCLEAWHQGIFHLAVSDAVFEEYQSVAWRVKEAEGLSGDPDPLLRLMRERALWGGAGTAGAPGLPGPQGRQVQERGQTIGWNSICAREPGLKWV